MSTIIYIPKFNHNRLKTLFESQEYLNKKYNITITSDKKMADIWIIWDDESILLLNDPDYTNPCPVIILERSASSVIAKQFIRKALQHPATIAIIKQIVANPYDLQNSLTCTDFRYCFHTFNNMINQNIESSIPHNIKLTAKDMSKIRIASWYDTRSIYNYRFNFLFRQPYSSIDEWNKRNIDVGFVGTTDYKYKSKDPDWILHKYKLLNLHRQLCCEKIELFKKNNQELKIVVDRNKVMSRKKYQSQLLTTKIVISPWGFGEFALRDWEGVLAGAVVIKPDSTYIRTDPDFYFDKGLDILSETLPASDNIKYTHIICSPDFKDLIKILNYIFINIITLLPLLKKIRLNAINILKERRDRRIHIDVFARHIIECFRQLPLKNIQPQPDLL